MSGIRNDPPISINSPRETGTSFLSASVFNLFLQSSMLMLVISSIGVLIFAGLTAFDTQRLKLTYHQLGGDAAAMGSATSFGALNLYLNFVNLFQFLLVLLGQRR